MEAAGGQVHELMRDIRAVAWLPLDAALARLTREHERAFLAEIGPRVLAAAAQDRRTAERRPPLVPDLPGPVPGPDASSSSGSGLAPSGGATVTAAEYLTADSVAVETPQGAIAGETMSRSRKPWLSRVWRWLSRGG
jgi:8-oxo-dGTP diphosphatase